VVAGQSIFGSGDADHDITKVALSAEDAVPVVRRLLAGETVLEEDLDAESEEEQPAFEVLFGANDPVETLSQLRGELVQERDNGKIVVSRT
jgi:hypothetical protein